MKKIFTFICLATMALLLTTPAMAQQRQFSQQEKEILAKELVPAMLEQVSQISGFDFMSLIKGEATIEDIVTSQLFTPIASTRAAAKPITFQPDSMVLDLSKVITLPEEYQGMASVLQVKLTFSNYETLSTEVNGSTVQIYLPKNIAASSVVIPEFGTLATITFAMTPQAGFLPFASISADLVLSETIAAILGGIEMGDITLASGNLFSFTERTTSAGVYQYDMELGASIRGFLGANSATTPNFRINTNMSQLQTAGTLSASLYGIIGSNPQIPMGDAMVYMNAAMQADSIILTKYDKGQRIGYRKLEVKMEQANPRDLVITNGDFSRTNEENVWVLDSTNIVTMTNHRAANQSAAVRDLVLTMLSDLATRAESNQYTMLVESVKEDEEASRKIFKVDILFELGGTIAAPENIYTMNISTPNASNTLAKSMRITASLPANSSTISVQFAPVSGETITPMATAYIKSNAVEFVTGNDAISENELKIASYDGGIQVINGQNSTYSIVNLLGSTVANGRITSDSQMIPTANIAKGGIYVLVVTNGNTQKTFKFIQ